MNALCELQHDFFEHQEATGSSVGTVNRQKVALRLFLHFLQEQQVFYVQTLTPKHLHAFQQWLNQRKTWRGTPMKPAAINTVLKGVRGFLYYLNDIGCLRQPLAPHLQFIREPKLLPESVLTHAQVRKLLRSINTTTPDGIRDRAAIELLYSSGIRVGELEKLRLQDLDMERGVARVIGKGSKERIVPIGETALKWLRSYLNGVRPFAMQGQQEAVFINARGERMRQRTLQERIRKYAQVLKVDFPVTPHTFRRSCTTELVKSNANLYHIKQLLGHEGFETLHRYAKLNISDLQKTHAKCHPRERDQS